MTKNKSITIAGETIAPGKSKIIQLAVARLYDYTELSMPIQVINGKKPGPVLFISAAIHGDEINGVEIIRRLLQHRSMKTLAGTLIAVPIVNVFGFNHKSRYLPDRRDLNRCFPGSKTGSLGARLANVFMEEIVKHCTHGIDLHTGTVYRSNLPQIRACLQQKDTKELAQAFGTSVVIDAALRDGSLREAVADLGIPMLVYEGGEALTYDNTVIQVGLKGILSVMRNIGMLRRSSKTKRKSETFIALSSHWARASNSGMLRSFVTLGKHVQKGDVLGVLSDPFGIHEVEIKAKATGLVIGHNRLPLVNRGDACFHVATFDKPQVVEGKIEEYDEFLDFNPVMDVDASL